MLFTRTEDRRIEVSSIIIHEYRTQIMWRKLILVFFSTNFSVNFIFFHFVCRSSNFRFSFSNNLHLILFVFIPFGQLHVRVCVCVQMVFHAFHNCMPLISHVKTTFDEITFPYCYLHYFTPKKVKFKQERSFEVT